MGVLFVHVLMQKRGLPSNGMEGWPLADAQSFFSVARANTAIELCEALTGISILRYHAQGLDLAIRSFFPTAVVTSAAEFRNLPFAKTEHELRVVLEPGSTLVQAVTLVPPDVPLESSHVQGVPLPDMVGLVCVQRCFR